MRYWLFKSEPSVWGWSDQLAKGDAGEEWDGVRNYRYGQSLGRNEAFDGGVTVEGAATARAVLARARALDLDMPVTHAITALVTGELRVSEAMDMLLSRPLKEE